MVSSYSSSFYFFLFSSPNLSRRRLHVYHTSTHGLSANLGYRSETCCTRLAENTARKKVAKKRHLGTIAQLRRTISSQLRHVWTVEKNVLSSNTSSTCLYNIVNFGSLAAEISLRVRVWGTPANLKGFRVLAALLHGI